MQGHNYKKQQWTDSLWLVVKCKKKKKPLIKKLKYIKLYVLVLLNNPIMEWRRYVVFRKGVFNFKIQFYNLC